MVRVVEVTEEVVPMAGLLEVPVEAREGRRLPAHIIARGKLEPGVVIARANLATAPNASLSVKASPLSTRSTRRQSSAPTVPPRVYAPLWRTARLSSSLRHSSTRPRRKKEMKAAQTPNREQGESLFEVARLRGSQNAHKNCNSSKALSARF